MITAYYILRPYHTDKRELIREVLRRNALPVFLTSLTTAVGFFSLASSRLASGGTIAIWLDLFYTDDEEIDIVLRNH